MPRAPRNGHGIELNGRNEEQPADKDRALDPSSERQDALSKLAVAAVNTQAA